MALCTCATKWGSIILRDTAATVSRSTYYLCELGSRYTMIRLQLYNSDQIVHLSQTSAKWQQKDPLRQLQ
jgi:hypothetical protein